MLKYPTERVVVLGSPTAGKTTFANTFNCYVRHSDDLLQQVPALGWHEMSQQIADEVGSLPGPWCFEGVALARSLRKALLARPDTKPCDRVVFLTTPRDTLTKGQATMAKGLQTVFAEIEPKLLALGVEIDYIDELD